MTTPFTPSSAYVPPTQADASLEAQLARMLAMAPPFLRLPKAGTRCPYTQLSRTSLSELVTPTLRNNGRPPVRAICQRAHPYARRGIWVIPAEALFRYLFGAGTQPAEPNQAVNRLRTDCGGERTPAARAAYSPAPAGGVHLNEDHASAYGDQETVRFPAQSSRPCGRPAPGLSVHLSLNPHMLFVPRASFGNRAVGGRLVKTIVPDDESSPPVTFIEIAEDEWASEIAEMRGATN